jgi:hypothetical protein
VALLQQALAQVRPDEAGAAGDEDAFHSGLVPRTRFTAA